MPKGCRKSPPQRARTEPMSTATIVYACAIDQIGPRDESRSHDHDHSNDHQRCRFHFRSFLSAFLARRRLFGHSRGEDRLRRPGRGHYIPDKRGYRTSGVLAGYLSGYPTNQDLADRVLDKYRIRFPASPYIIRRRGLAMPASGARAVPQDLGSPFLDGLEHRDLEAILRAARKLKFPPNPQCTFRAIRPGIFSF